MSFGATMTELWVKDKFGNPRDIILGYDDNVSATAASSGRDVEPIPRLNF